MEPDDIFDGLEPADFWNQFRTASGAVGPDRSLSFEDIISVTRDSAVYQARLLDGDKFMEVAVKVFAPNMTQARELRAYDEIRTLDYIHSRRKCTTIIDYYGYGWLSLKVKGRTDPVRFLVLILELGKRSLSSVVTRLPVSSPERIKNVLAATCSLVIALNDLRRLQLIHRDLFPKNVVLTAEGVWKLIDFETVIGYGAAKTHYGIGGTADNGLYRDGKTDRENLAIFIVNALTGKRLELFQGAPPKIFDHHGYETSTDDELLPGWATRVIESCLKPESNLVEIASILKIDNQFEIDCGDAANLLLEFISRHREKMDPFEHIIFGAVMQLWLNQLKDGLNKNEYGTDVRESFLARVIPIFRHSEELFVLSHAKNLSFIYEEEFASVQDSFIDSHPGRTIRIVTVSTTTDLQLVMTPLAKHALKYGQGDGGVFLCLREEAGFADYSGNTAVSMMVHSVDQQGFQGARGVEIRELSPTFLYLHLSKNGLVIRKEAGLDCQTILKSFVSSTPDRSTLLNTRVGEFDANQIFFRLSGDPVHDTKKFISVKGEALGNG